MTEALPGATHLVQLLLPLNDNDGKPFAKARFDAVRAELVERFGGVTAYVRSPAVGAWENEDGAVCRDDVILFEVMSTNSTNPGGPHSGGRWSATSTRRRSWSAPRRCKACSEAIVRVAVELQVSERP